ncbi:MAG: HAMP domain-containing histidine kinase, partial [Gammaproteobacteria bacterium]|nr:HAMP domain-containing histidine kinase [Gammaproteobacteria bacterium]
MNEISSTTSDALRDVLGADPVPAQIDSLRNESREFTVASVFAAIIATLALWPAAVHDSLLIWAALAISWSLLREVFMHFYDARVPPRALSASLVVPAGVAGAIWGVLPLLFFDAQNVAASVFLVLVVVSLSAVSLVWLSALKSVYFAFATPALLSLVWVLFAARFLVAGILTVTVLAVALYLAYKLDRALRHSAGLLERNNELNAQLRAGGTGIREARKAVERASMAKAEFLAAAGLGLRQRLYAMNLLIDSVRSSTDETERQSAIDRIDQSFQGLDAAFESLLDMSRLEAKRVPADQQSFHVRDVIMPLRGAWEALAASQGLTFRSRVLDAVLRSDPRLLQRIVRHLVNNALLHTTQGGVLLATRLRPAEVWIEVWDTGPGIADDQQDQVFQEYFKIEPADGSRSPGLGLGLAIVQRLCRLLKHPVEIHSRPGRGSLFRVRVPRGSPRALRDSLWSDEYTEMQMEGNTILILDGKRAM